MGADSGRHSWFKFVDGPVPEGTKSTQAILLVDMLLLSVTSGFATEEYSWAEQRPCSEKNTRVLGVYDLNN